MLKELHHTNRLPALVFCFDRQMCEDLVKSITDLLGEMEAKKRKEEGADEKEAARFKQREKLLKAAKKQAERAEKASTAKGSSGGKGGKDERDVARDADRDQPTIEIEAEIDYPVDPRYTFVGEGEYMDSEELEWWKKRMLYKTKYDKSHALVRALDRGIGVHHSGLHKSYKDLVETLFRIKQLKVVVATETLALGVNMPAKTSIFALDHRLLTPLQYRQMSGRAGRRGFDNVGHVVFFGVPPRKVFRLMKSPLTSLQGHFPLSTSLVLRMITYFDRAPKARKPDVVDGLRGLLQKPFCFTTSGIHAPIGQDVPEERYLGQQIEHYFRFSVEYLVRKRLINSKGEPVGLAGLVTNMHPMEPSNFAFVRLLETGVIHRTCALFLGKKEKAAQELMLILCHLFNTVPIATEKAKWLRETADPASGIWLADLKPPVQQVLDDHNREVMHLFSQCAQVFALSEFAHKNPQEDVTLPYSNRVAAKARADDTKTPQSKVVAAPELETVKKQPKKFVRQEESSEQDDDEEEATTSKPVMRQFVALEAPEEEEEIESWEDEGGPQEKKKVEKKKEVSHTQKKEIGRAVQQECRDRSRMPSSA
eukprot:TRINITY_DN9780_c0_g1_i15.p1 TRINITY_DN9780_c0_g1~~TRINITY_DN9780_c0_g1_i15.p1  ORF type:complete len:594 (-),score=95.60 TRINITY_DN9780_c0_g1_i15:25-1806(-)